MALKSSHESVCVRKDGPDSHFHCEDYMKFYDDLVRGLFVDIDACLDFNSSSSQQSIGRYSGGKCIESPTNAPKSSSYIILDDDDNIETSLSKKRNGNRLTDKGDVNVDLVNGLVENNIGGNGAVDGVDLDTRSIDGDATPFSLADGFGSLGKGDVGRDDARVGDNDIVDDGHLNNGIVGEEAGDDGNNADDGSLGDGADNDEEPGYKMFWDNYRQDVKSCVLEISFMNEITVTVSYASQDGAYDRCHIQKPDTEKDCPKSKNTGTRKLLKIDPISERMEARSDTMKERVEAPRKLGDVPARERKVSVVESKMKKEDVNARRMDVLARPSLEALGTTNCKRQHEIKLDMAQTVLREVPFNPDKERTENQRKSGAVPSTQRKVSAVISKARKESMDPVSCRENVHARKWHSQETIRLNICKRKRKMHLDMENFRMETQRKMKDFSAKERGNLAVEREFKRQSLNAVPCGANGHASKKPSPQGPSSTNCKRKCEMNVDMVDHSNQLFLNSCKKDGGYVVFAPQKWKRSFI
ncbi:hypothetical protein D5086_011119 [Populus alba]|uniref:Uncharacterized protein n=1 Tax=Populus alba TaxID=43335 RepID=A0ACC4CCX1_POPAL